MKDPVFFAPSRRFLVGEIATLTGARLRDPDKAGAEITGLAAASEGGAGALIFIEGLRNAARLHDVQAAAMLCTPDVAEQAPADMAVLVTDRPHSAFAAVARLLFPSATRLTPLTGETGISPKAHIAADAHIEAGAIVEAGAVIGAGAAIGRGTVVSPNAVIGQACRIGRDCYIGPGVSVQCAMIGDHVAIHSGAQIGQDGFGYLPGREGLEKIPQIGRVVIQDHVEIGANTTVDRGALTDTVIGEGTKIDNLVQIAHNVRIGRGCIIAGHCGLSGSVTLEDHVMLGGRVGLADHITIGAGAQLAASSGVMRDVPAGERWAGSPAKPLLETFRELAALRDLVQKRRKGKQGDG